MVFRAKTSLAVTRICSENVMAAPGVLSNGALVSRQGALELNVSLSSAHQILTEDLGLHPYKWWTRQQVTPKNMADRVVFCRWFL